MADPDIADLMRDELQKLVEVQQELIDAQQCHRAALDWMLICDRSEIGQAGATYKTQREDWAWALTDACDECDRATDRFQRLKFRTQIATAGSFKAWMRLERVLRGLMRDLQDEYRASLEALREAKR